MSDDESTKYFTQDSDPFDTESMFANAYSFLGIPFSMVSFLPFGVKQLMLPGLVASCHHRLLSSF